MWFYVAIGAALFSGLYTVISKNTLKNINSVIFFWSVLVISTPIVFIYSFRFGIPAINTLFIVGITGSVILYTVSKIIFNNVIREADLSCVYPLISISPVFTSLFAFFILKERLSTFEIIGSLITLCGVYVLNISSLREGLLEPFKILFKNRLAFFMLISMVFISMVTVFDKLALTNTYPQNTSFTVLVENLVIIIGLLPWIIIKRKSAFSEIFNNKKYIILLGILGAASNILIFSSLGSSEAGLVTSVFRAQVFFVLLFSSIFFKDKPKLETIIGTVIMILGLVIIKLFS